MLGLQISDRIQMGKIADPALQAKALVLHYLQKPHGSFVVGQRTARAARLETGRPELNAW